MARIASQAKGGYFATPEHQMDLIIKRLYVEQPQKEKGFINMLDPCCGRGWALKQLGAIKSTNVSILTYGCEIEKGRAVEAQNNLYKVVNDGYEGLRCTPGFSILWLNPPYDNGPIERIERTFFRELTTRERVLEKGALVMFCIPQHVLDDCAGLIANRLSNVTVYRFTDEDFLTFKQVVVFGYFQKGEDTEVTRRWLKELSQKDPEELPTLAEADNITYQIPLSKKKIEYFRGHALNPTELYKDLQKSTVFGEIQDLFTPPSHKRAVLKRPILPLKEMHYGTAIAAKAVGGLFKGENGTDPFIVESYTKVEKKTQEILDNEGNPTGEKNTYYHVSVPRVFTPKGIFDLN